MRSWLRTLHASLLTLAVVLTLAATVRTGAPERNAQPVQAAAATRPARPPITATRAGSHRIKVIWRHRAARGSARITGYRVWRNGKDLAGKRAWSRRVSAQRRSLTVKGLRNGTRYTFSVAATSRAGRGRPARVRRVPLAFARVAGPTPDAPTITASSTGADTMRVTWAPPALAGTSAISGYRVARDGTDAEGKGPWSTVVPATQRSFEMTLLRTGVTYTFSVSALNASGAGPAASVRLTPGATTPPPSGRRPVVVQSAVGQPVTLRQGGAGGARLRMAGVAVWGVPDIITEGGGFGLGQYNNRARIVAAVKAWGGNHIRLRVLADDYNNDRQGLSKARRLAMIKDWRDTATAAGLYFYVTWWDSLDGYAEDANWPARHRTAFAMMTDVHRTLGNDDRVFYEPFNEPNSFGNQWPAWSTAMRATVAHWRSIGYTGVLVIDTPVWSHAYDDAAMTALETYDAGRPGMGGKHQLAFAKHDYANEGWPDGNNTFSATKWRADTGGADRDHLIWETEFGNYNGSPSTVHPSWSRQAAAFFTDELNGARPNYVGYTAFVWGPWWDANALTDTSNSTPTVWGQALRDAMTRAAATRF